MQIQATLQPNRILADEPPAIRIVGPIPVVVQTRLVIMVLPLEPNRVGDRYLAGRFPNRLLRDTPRTVFRAPRNFAVLVRQLLRRAEVVALVPGQAVDRRRRRRRAPQRVFVLPVVAPYSGWSSSSMASSRTACATGTKLPGS